MKQMENSIRVLFKSTWEKATAGIALGENPTEQGLRKKLILDSFNYFLSKIIPAIFGLLSVLVFVRLVGLAEYGRYSVLFAVVTACTAGLSGWLPQGILRYFSTSTNEHEARHFKAATILGSLLSILAGAIVLGVALWLERQPLWGGILGVSLLAAGMLYGVLLIELQAMLKSASVASVEAVRSISSFVVPVCIIFLTGKKSASVLLAGVLVAYILPLLMSRPNGHDQGRFLSTILSAGPWKDENGVLRRIWTYGWPVGVCGMCLTLQSAIDRYFIQRYSGSAQAGSYAAMYDVIVRSFSLICFPLVLSSNSLIITRWNKCDRRGAVSLIESSLKYQMVICALFFLVLALSTQQVSHIILGSKFESSSSLVLPLAAGGFLWQISYLVHKPLELLCLTKRMLAAMIAALAVSVIGNFLLIPVYGYTAAAYVAIAAPLTYLLIALVLTPMAEFRREISLSAVPLIVEESNHGD